MSLYCARHSKSGEKRLLNSCPSIRLCFIFHPSVRPHWKKNWLKLDRFSWNLLWDFYYELRRNFLMDKNVTYFRSTRPREDWSQSMISRWSISGRRKASHKNFTVNQHPFHVKHTLFSSRHLRDNYEKYATATLAMGDRP